MASTAEPSGEQESPLTRVSRPHISDHSGTAKPDQPTKHLFNTQIGNFS
jgi:hypothetical protein